MSTTNGGPDIVNSGLVLHLDTANNKSYINGSVTWTDLTTNKNNATLVNTPTVNYQGVTLDGNNDYIYINHGGKLSFSSGNFTICVWNKNISNPTSIYNGIITNDDALDNAWKIYKDVGHDYYTARSGATTIRFSSYTINKFQMYAYTFNAGTILTYLDGVYTGYSASSAPNPTSNNNIAFGSYRYQDAVNLNYLSNQTIGPTMLYNRALSASEILQNYNALKSRFNLL